MNKYLFVFSLICFLTFSCVSTNNEVSSETKPQTTSNIDDAEYKRSIKDLNGSSVSQDTFNADKKDILKIISELNIIMKQRNFVTWQTYVEPNSVKYWSNRTNLAKIEDRIPGKNKLNTLEDYFNFVFIPSRIGKRIDEIRYVSSTSIKAVQIDGDSTIVYYNFNKIKDKWMVVIPKL